MKLISFLNLLDKDGKLSITNSALYVILAKVALSPFDWTAAVTLFVAIINYAHKRQLSQEPDQAIEKLNELTSATEKQITELQNNISTLAVKVGLK